MLATGIELYRRGIDLRDPQGYAQDTILAVQSGFESQDLFGKQMVLQNLLNANVFDNGQEKIAACLIGCIPRTLALNTPKSTRKGMKIPANGF